MTRPDVIKIEFVPHRAARDQREFRVSKLSSVGFTPPWIFVEAFETLPEATEKYPTANVSREARRAWNRKKPADEVASATGGAA